MAKKSKEGSPRKPKTQMKAPKNTTSAVIDGHEYEIGEDGVIDVVSATHLPTLRRHGFVDHVTQEDAENTIDNIEDKGDLVAFIEERGGEADTSMGMKKLKRLARQAVTEDE